MTFLVKKNNRLLNISYWQVCKCSTLKMLYIDVPMHFNKIAYNKLNPRSQCFVMFSIMHKYINLFLFLIPFACNVLTTMKLIPCISIYLHLPWSSSILAYKYLTPQNRISSIGYPTYVLILFLTSSCRTVPYIMQVA